MVSLVSVVLEGSPGAAHIHEGRQVFLRVITRFDGFDCRTRGVRRCPGSAAHGADLVRTPGRGAQVRGPDERDLSGSVGVPCLLAAPTERVELSGAASVVPRAVLTRVARSRSVTMA